MNLAPALPGLLLGLLALTPALPGRVARLEVRVPAVPGVQVSRAAPNRLTLQTPWGRQTRQLTGMPDRRDPDHYFARLDPLTFSVPLPQRTPAAVAVTLTAELYLCDRRSGQCYRRTLNRPIRLALSGPAQTRLNIAPALLAPEN